MQAHPWKRLLTNAEVHGRLAPVSDELLDTFEKEHHVKLPTSYREYCKVFGPGRLRGVASVKIAVPGERKWQWDADLAQLNEYLSGIDPIELEEYCPNPELWRNGLFFATDGGDSYLWNKNEVVDTENGEMAIYVILRDMQIYRLADTFESFIFDICLGQGIPGRSKLDYSPAVFRAGVNVV